VNILFGDVTVKYSGEEAAKIKEVNTTLLKNIFLQILSWTDIKLGQNLEHIKKNSPELYKKFDRYGRVRNTLLYSFQNGNNSYVQFDVENDLITSIRIYKYLTTESAAKSFFEDFYRQLKDITPNADLYNDQSLPGLFERPLTIDNAELNLKCMISISKSNPKSVSFNVEKIK
jgi:hypothetical protein